MEGLKSVAESSVPLSAVLSVNEAALSRSVSLSLSVCRSSVMSDGDVLHHEAFVQAGKMMGLLSTDHVTSRQCIHTQTMV